MHTAIGSGSPLRLARSNASRRCRPKSSLTAVRRSAGELQPMIGGVVGAGVGVAHDHDAGGDEAAGVGGGVVQRRQHAGEVDVLGVDVLLRRRLLHQHRRLRRAERAADELADAVEVDAEGGLAIVLAGQQVSDHRHVVAVDGGEQERRPAVELLHDGGDFEVRIDRRRVGREPSLLRHAVERRAEARVEDAGIGHVRCLSICEGACLIARAELQTNAKHDNGKAGSGRGEYK